MKKKDNLTGIRAAIKSLLHVHRTQRKGKTIEERIESDLTLPIRLAAISLFHSIKSEIEPILEKEREAYERLNGKRHESQGFVFDLSKYLTASQGAYSFGRETEPDLAAENDPRFAMIQECVKLSENKTISEVD